MNDTLSDADGWRLYVGVQKDIVYFLHICESAGTFQNDLDYSTELTSEFWRVLRESPRTNPDARQRADEAFLVNGALWLICVHCSAFLEGADRIIDFDRLAEYEAAVAEVVVEDEDAPLLDVTRRLVALCRQYGPTGVERQPFRDIYHSGAHTDLDDLYALCETRIRNWHAYWTKRGLYG